MTVAYGNSRLTHTRQPCVLAPSNRVQRRKLFLFDPIVPLCAIAPLELTDRSVDSGVSRGLKAHHGVRHCCWLGHPALCNKHFIANLVSAFLCHPSIIQPIIIFKLQVETASQSFSEVESFPRGGCLLVSLVPANSIMTYRYYDIIIQEGSYTGS